ncbi:DNA-binding HxlR family transcriptional regulator [Kitasatospora sp. MAP12-15]|uniref:replication-relaxation family protein n=1 Tax=unclassified Kitasatospora TaxID=2633591 RepID=UPI002476F0FF|nr:replication-relaxation family protein [Kitasatospora sp. MAP12-44]MDH6115657.1 DNA-binding HxlR family transcriptional regulator [Kitasatospora sp. MAP12-44]
MPYQHPAPKGIGVIGQQAMTVLYQHRLVSTDQLHRLITPHHTGPEYLRRQLHVLRDAGLADRVGRRTHGQTSLLWWLTEKGAAAVEAVGLLPQRPYRMSPEAAAGPLQEHTLATIETGCAFVAWAQRLDHECGPLDWSPETAHHYRDDTRPGEDLTLIPDAVLNYVHTDAAERTRTLLTFFVELDRTTMTIARLAQKLHAYARYHQYIPQPPGPRTTRTTVRSAAAVPAWRSRYPAFPRLLLVLTGAEPARLQRRIADLRSLAASDPLLTASPIRVGATTLDQLRERGPFAPIFNPVLSADGPVDAWLRPQAATPA